MISGGRNKRSRAILVAIGVLFISACAGTAGLSGSSRMLLPPLQTETAEISLQQASVLAKDVDLLAINAEMKDLAEQHTANARTGRQRLMMLHQSLRAGGAIDLDYNPDANGSAAQTFASRSANCLSYASLFISLARHLGLNANYQTVSTRPQWNRVGERLTVAMHVNTTVSLRNGQRFEVDIAPLQRSRIVGTQVLSDSIAKAHYYNNIGMEYFFGGHNDKAFINMARALELAPQLDYLWANIGAVYRDNGQHDAAELSYQTALRINPDFSTAMNNLVVLYLMEGKQSEAKFYSDQIERHRLRNPYYHYQQAQIAENSGDYEQAIVHLRDAISRKNSDGEFYYLLSRIYFKTNRPEKSLQNIKLAIDHSTMLDQKKRYRDYLQHITGDSQSDELI